MYIVHDRESPPIESAAELVSAFERWQKPRAEWRVGTEYELIGVRARGDAIGAAPGYGAGGIGAVFDGLVAAGWSPIEEGGNVIALVDDSAQVTVEPGGQLEHAARPVHRAGELEADSRRYLAQLAGLSRELGLAWLGVGFRPFGTIDDVQWMPKGRYAVMREYMPTRGRLAHEMMKRTATVQVNLDYGSAEDARATLRCLMSITSILTAIYANSPIVDGVPSGYASYRTRVWMDTDPDRCGLLRLAFDDGDIFRSYVDWALDVPMFFVHRGRYIPARGTTFRAFLRDGFDGYRATMDDWELHLSTLFPEARMKRFIEVRGCDGGSLEMNLALGPLCRGLIYDDTARTAATALTAGLSFDERMALWNAVAREGLAAAVPGGGRRVLELARELVAIASDGLSRQAPEELRYLDPVRAVVESGRTQADAFSELWSESGADPGRVIPKLAYGGLSS